MVASEGSYGIDESGAWVTPFILDEYDPNVMFIGYKNVWRCENVKAGSSQISWKRISYDLAGNNGENMAVLEQSPANTDVLYAARYDNRLFRTDEAFAGDPDWYDLSAYLPASGSINDVEAHPTDESTLYILIGSGVYKSTDKGISWTDISGSLPDVSMTSIAFYTRGQEALYLASDLGVFHKDASMSDWIWFNQGLPVDASVREIEIWYHPDSLSEDVIRAGTYGRGMWSSDLWFATPEAAFSSSDTIVPPNCGVNFFDASSGMPHYFEWSFEGASPSTSTEQNPEGIEYSTPGTYAVALKVWNDLGEDSTYVAGYITVSDEILPEVEFSADVLMPCGTDIVHFTDLSGNCPDTWTWQIFPEDILYVEGTTEHSQHPAVQFTSPGTYTVTLIAENSNGQESLTKTDYIIIGGMPLPYSEDFEGGSFTDAGWMVENPDMNITWEMTEVVGTNPGNQAAWINIFDYYAFGPRDLLISPPLDFSDYSNPGLYFEHAYAYRYALADTLIVKISTDCGNSWTRLWSAALEDLETAPESEESFIPQNADDWCMGGYGNTCNIIDLSAYAGQTGVKIAFESFGRYGNNMYIDNITISNSVGTGEDISDQDDILIYPNPSDGIFNIVLPTHNEGIEMNVRDMHGRLVHAETIEAEASMTRFNAGGLNKGIYVISFVSGEMNVNSKIIVQ